MKNLIILIPIIVLGFGCSSYRGNYLAPIAGAASGYLVGEQIDEGTAGRMGGAIVGMVAAQRLNEKMQETRDQQLAEAYQQGKREARLETANEFWREKTYAEGDHPNLKDRESQRTRQIQHEPRMVEGVNYGASYEK